MNCQNIQKWIVIKQMTFFTEIVYNTKRSKFLVVVIFSYFNINCSKPNQSKTEMFVANANKDICCQKINLWFAIFNF
jgi:hypothetical protein